MARYAVLDENNVVTNVIEAEENEEWPDNYVLCPEFCNFGQKYENNQFVDNVQQAEPDVANSPVPLSPEQTMMAAMAQMKHNFGDGRVALLRGPSSEYIDESLIRNTIEKMQQDTLATTAWKMEDGVWYNVTLEEMRQMKVAMENQMWQICEQWKQSEQPAAEPTDDPA